ncbi:MAG TPA: hypothetical protein VMT19_00450 [Thermoanaerobaculaceae bacterium]|nr:hypothetical protein [Thermoanaerobaculaceae bacterium]
MGDRATNRLLSATLLVALADPRRAWTGAVTVVGVAWLAGSNLVQPIGTLSWHPVEAENGRRERGFLTPPGEGSGR